MWLIDTKTLRLHQINDLARVRYLILSHTWDDEEISFQDIQDLHSCKFKPGFAKVKNTCDIALSKKFKYAWIDTCCIDKTNSVELSEAINSMFRWYKESEACYVLLTDFNPIPHNISERTRLQFVRVQLPKCRWFTRGWTLQELIAPNHVEFFDREWNFIGGKHNLQGILAQITNVDESILKDSSGLAAIPVARKMSWAAGRQTTRIEDRAYSLLGIFDINMPLLYGEGLNSFLRLQQQVASQSTDLSIFAWQYSPGSEKHGIKFGGIFADSPDDFQYCSTLKRHMGRFHRPQEFAMTNSGLRMEDNLHLLDPVPGSIYEMELRLDLECAETSERTGNATRWIAIRLVKIENTYLRLEPSSVVITPSERGWVSSSVSDSTGEPLRDTGARVINIQPILRAQDVERISWLMNTGVVIAYDQEMVDNVVSRTGLPASSCSRNQEHNQFVFDIQGRDSFLGVHVIHIKSAKRHTVGLPNHTLFVVCKLQWGGSSYQLRIGIFDHADLQEELGTDRGSSGETHILKALNNILLIRYSDISGLLSQEKMPTRAFIGSGGQSRRLITVRHVRQLEGNPLSALFNWREGYFHVILDHKHPMLE
jgi:hypothetical protein